MFSSPRVNVMESSDGFAVEVLGRTGLRYTEGGKTALVDSEVEVQPTGMRIDATSIRRWEAPHADEPIDDATRARIVENICAAFRSYGAETSVFWGY